MSKAIYPPLDTPKPVTNNIWIVDSGPLRLAGMPVPVRMTVIKLRNGELILHSPTQFSFALKAQLDSLGRIAYFLAPNTAHWTFIKEWQAHYPQAQCWAVPGLGERPAVQKSGLHIDREFRDGAPEEWAEEIEIILVRGKGLVEADFFHRASKTLVLTDLIVNLEPQKLGPTMRLGARLVGALAPNGKAPVYARALVKGGGKEAEAAGRRLLALKPERVLFAHGHWHEHDGTAKLEQSLDWLVTK
ncbi:MAG TPA: DUF4336 domain-containing protein [Devosia sp.]|jgi:hypothetical protein